MTILPWNNPIFVKAGYEYEKWDFMRRDLREVNALMSVDDNTFQGIIGLWIAVFRRTYAYYDLAGEAYFKVQTFIRLLKWPNVSAKKVVHAELRFGTERPLYSVHVLRLSRTTDTVWGDFCILLVQRRHEVSTVYLIISLLAFLHSIYL